MNNKLPTIQEYRRILSIAKDHHTLETTLSSLRNAWLLCDTEYVTAHSDLADVHEELRKLESRYKELKNKGYELETKVDDMNEKAMQATRVVNQRASASELLNKIKSTYRRNIDVELDDEKDNFDDCDGDCK